MTDVRLAQSEHDTGHALFRNEVLAERQTQWLGTVLLQPRVTSTLVASASVLAALALILLLILGSYTRKAHVEGWLVPELGLVRVYAPHAGVVTGIHAREGKSVKQGELLLTLSAELRSESFGATYAEIAERLKLRLDSTANSKRAQEELYEQKKLGLRQRLSATKTQLQHLTAEIAFQRERLAIGRQALKRERAMRARDLIPLTRLQKTEQAHLDQAASLEILERNQADLRGKLAEQQGSLAELPMLRDTAVAEIERGKAALEQELAEAEARRQTVIVAPQDGIVTAILSEPGGNATPATPLLSLVPANSKLQAQLYSPSRAIGFVRVGQRVSLRLQPFPFQKFGAYGGTVASISRSPVSPAELPQQFSNFSELAGGSEPVYRVIVDLDRQSAKAYGKDVPLQPGMQIDADIVIETRRLGEWILDPLYSLTGKMGG